MALYGILQIIETNQNFVRLRNKPHSPDASSEETKEAPLSSSPNSTAPDELSDFGFSGVVGQPAKMAKRNMNAKQTTIIFFMVLDPFSYQITFFTMYFINQLTNIYL